ncbi:MAG: ParB/RepB/Spo0J family partition protein [Porphyromonas sp.]|nr:ParB/RepB/Spo0J family partition protein [Porphyromonas sp.]
MSKKRNRSLGRGLGSLLGDDMIPEIQPSGASSISEILLEEIEPNKEQPRSFFDENALLELTNSIKSVGIIQPITVFVNKEEGGKRYKIISGERRYKASLLAGLTTIPAYVRTAEDEHIMEMALIENIQREDLNPIEVSLAFRRLIEEYELTQEELSGRVGKNRATIANYLRLLKLPSEVQMGLKDRVIDMGHARALLPLEDSALQIELYRQILIDHLSVRQVEAIVKRYKDDEKKLDNKDSGVSLPKKSTEKAAELDLLTQRFSAIFKTNVNFTLNKQGKGKITIPFASEEQLESILHLLDSLPHK